MMKTIMMIMIAHSRFSAECCIILHIEEYLKIISFQSIQANSEGQL